jgi:hypothetical protein
MPHDDLAAKVMTYEEIQQFRQSQSAVYSLLRTITPIN